MNDTKKKGLGRGLDALLGNENFDFLNEGEMPQKSDDLVDINLLFPSPFQPRKDFDIQALNSLVDSIREKGILQPLLVRKNGDKFEIIAGERRYRAAKIAGINMLPVIIKDIDDKEALEIALIENIMRENLSPIEEAEGYARLMNEFSHTQEALSQVIGKSRSQVANTLRLLNLPDSVKQMLRENKLSAGHAKMLVGLDNAEELAQKIVNDGLSVRQIEKLVAKQKNPTPSKKISSIKSPEFFELEQDLYKSCGLQVKICPSKKGSGSVSIKYDSIAQLEKIVELLETK